MDRGITIFACREVVFSKPDGAGWQICSVIKTKFWLTFCGFFKIEYDYYKQSVVVKFIVFFTHYFLYDILFIHILADHLHDIKLSSCVWQMTVLMLAKSKTWRWLVKGKLHLLHLRKSRRQKKIQLRQRKKRKQSWRQVCLRTYYNINLLLLWLMTTCYSYIWLSTLEN